MSYSSKLINSVPRSVISIYYLLHIHQGLSTLKVRSPSIVCHLYIRLCSLSLLQLLLHQIYVISFETITYN